MCRPSSGCPQGEVTSGGMANHHHPVRIDPRELGACIYGASRVEKGGRPSTIATQTTVLDVPSYEPGGDEVDR
jgi:hypothetical protein